MIGSMAVHALLAWLVFHGDREGELDAAATRPASITVTEAVEVELLPSTQGGAPNGAVDSGAPNGAAPASALATTSHARGAPTRSRTVDTDPRGAITIERTDLRDLRIDALDRSGDVSDAGDGRSGRDRGGGASDTDGGSGPGGRGLGLGRGGTGTGIGFGDGGSIQRSELLSPPPAPGGDPPSKARPARLIYPTRQRDVEDAALFIARVIIDDDGFVAGAKLVRGFGGRRDEVASQMIWKFRYAPALDDGGRPVRSSLDQRFLVGP